MSGAGAVLMGVGKLANKLSRYTVEKEKALQTALVRGGNMIAASAKKEILRGVHSGKKYGRHTASAPGESPANDLGNLARNIRVLRDNGVVWVMSGAKYSAALEFGTETIKPRPFMGPAVLANKELIRLMIRKAKELAAHQ